MKLLVIILYYLLPIHRFDSIMAIRQYLSLIVCCCFLSSFIQAADKNGSKKGAGNLEPIKNITQPNTSKGSVVKTIDTKIIKQAEELKKEMIQLNRELYQFEEDLLYPANSQLAVFLSLSSDSSFVLDSVELRLDDKMVSTYLYKKAEIVALKKGGIQRIYLGSLSDGRHKLTAQFNGQGANNRYFRRKKALSFNKEDDAKYIQMTISESSTNREPLFKVKQW